MDDLFADRHRDVSIQPNDIDLEARWTAAESLASDLDVPHTAYLVEYAYGQFGELDDEWLRRPFKDAEPAFAMKNNDAEMSMLSGCVLDQAIHHGPEEIAILAGYLCQLGHELGWAEPFQGFTDAATRRLRALSIERRTPQPPPDISKPTGPWHRTLQNKLKANKEVAATTGEVFEDVLSRAADDTSKALTAIADQLSAVTTWAERRVTIAEEETGLLYWLLAGHSAIADVPWASLPPDVVAVLGPRELVDQIAMLPEPPQSVALLTQLLRMAGPDTAEKPDVREISAPPEIARFFGGIKNGDLPTTALHSLHQALALRAWKAASSDEH